MELAQTQRLLLAKQLLTESNLPIIQVAYASGFKSVRRFNALFRSHYRLSPSRMRRSSQIHHNGDCVRLTLAYRPPLAWDALLRFLSGRATAGVESVTGQAYVRTAAVGSHQGWLKVEPICGRNALAVELATSLVPALPEVLVRLKNLFDLNARPDVIASHLGADARLASIANECPGLRVPGAFDGFELALRAILGQRVSVRAATTLAGRLATVFGELDRDAVSGPRPPEPHAGPAGGRRGNGADGPGHRSAARGQHSGRRARRRRPTDRPSTGSRPGGDDPRPPENPRNRRLDGPVHRHARPALARRLSRR